jgi:hypothetical protein
LHLTGYSNHLYLAVFHSTGNTGENLDPAKKRLESEDSVYNIYNRQQSSEWLTKSNEEEAEYYGK